MLINALRDERPTHLAVAFDVCRQTFRSERVPGVQGQPLGDARRVQGAGQRSSRRCSRRCAIPVVTAEGFEADDVIATLTEQAEREGYDVAIITGDRDAFQLVSDHVTVLYPRRGVSDLAVIDPGRGRGALRAHPGAVPRLRGAARRPERQPARASPASGRRPRRSGSASSARSARSSTGSTRSRARPATRCARTWLRCCATAGSPSWSATCRCRSRRPTSRCAPGTATRCTSVFDTLQFRVLRDRLYQTLEAAEPEADEGFEVDVDACSRPARWRPWLAAHAGDGARAGVARRRAPGAAAPATSTGARRWRRPTAPAAWLDPAALTPDDDAALAGVARRRPTQPKALHDAKGPLLALGARGWTAGRRHRRHRAVRLPRAAGAAHRSTWPTCRCGSCTASCARRPTTTASCPSTAATRPTAARGAGGAGRAPCVDLADVLDAELEAKGADAAAARRRAAAGRRARRHGAHRHRRRRRRTWPTCRAEFAGEVKDAAQEALRGRRARVQPRARPSSCRRSCSTSSACRRPSGSRPATPPTPTRCRRCTRRPSTRCWRTCCATATSSKLLVTVEGLQKSVADDGRIHTTFNQTVAATGRLSSHRPQPAEHPDPHRGGPARSGEAFVVGPRLRVAADRRLQPGRDADHGAPVRGRRR